MNEKLDSLRAILRKDIVLATKLLSAMEKTPRDYCKVPPGIDLEANDEVRTSLIDCLSEILGRGNQGIIDAGRFMDDKYSPACQHRLV